MSTNGPRPNCLASETGLRVDAAREWRSPLAGLVAASLLFLTVTGVAIFAAPLWRANEFGVLLHTAVGLVAFPPLLVYSWRHWKARRAGRLSHFQLLGYASVAALLICCGIGLVETWQGLFGVRVPVLLRRLHLISGVAGAVFLGVHLVTLVQKRVAASDVLERLRPARALYFRRAAWGTAVLSGLWAAWTLAVRPPDFRRPFPQDYNWRFGADRPFAPSLARIDDEGWSERLTDRVAALVPEERRAEFLAVAHEPDPDRKGLFYHLREAADAVSLDDAARDKMEGLLEEGAAELRARGAVDPRALSGSARCGSAGCHEQIHREWLPSAHRYSSLDGLFQRVQAVMAKELSPEHTRYCAGCHDPISLFSGSKNPGNITLSTEGAEEGSSCLVCHSIVQTDVQGNGDYTIRVPRRTAYEDSQGVIARRLGDFVIRTLPDPHVHAYSRSLYKTPEFCAACHKQYIDVDVNLDIGKVQGQNQYDNWRVSRWNREDDPSRTITCRECHLPLAGGPEPASGDAVDPNRSPDDGRHRDHSMVGANTFVPTFHELEHWKEHVAKVEQWLRGERDVPEIADRWTTGPAIRMQISAPKTVAPGDEIPVRVLVTNNKAGHDFPTGPLDMIESWLEITVRDAAGRVLEKVGSLDEKGRVVDAPVAYYADEFDREGATIDRHNLWDLVGAAYKRSLFPGVTDTVEAKVPCPALLSIAPDREGGDEPGRMERAVDVEVPEGTMGTLTIEARLLYRKANARFLDVVFGDDANVRAPVVEVHKAATTVEVVAP